MCNTEYTHIYSALHARGTFLQQAPQCHPITLAIYMAEARIESYLAHFSSLNRSMLLQWLNLGYVVWIAEAYRFNWSGYISVTLL